MIRKLGDTVDRVVPKSLSLFVWNPVLKRLPVMLKDSTATMTYDGNGKYTLYGDEDEKALGKMEGLMCVFPSLIACVFAVYVGLLSEAVPELVGALLALLIVVVGFSSIPLIRHIEVERSELE